MRPKDLKSPFDWENRHVTIEDRIWYVPGNFEDYHLFTFPGWHHSSIFDEQKPICLEFCSGNGAWIAEKARSSPNFNWVAIERKFVRVRKIWSKIKNLNLKNLLAVCSEGYTLSEKYLPSESVQKVFINFPDPWPKTRHGKHRIIQAPFIKEMSRILQLNGELTIVTDDEDYSKSIIKILREFPTFQSLCGEDYCVEEYPQYGTSYFEDLWRGQGKKIRYHLFRKVTKEKDQLNG